MGKRICYIVGAGGSCAYGLPNGRQLVLQMMGLKGQGSSEGSERHHQFAKLRARLIAANPDSIDEYIQELSEAGHDAEAKLKASAAYGVAVVLLRAQIQHEIHNERPDDWIFQLTRRHKKNLMNLREEPEISFITYNYDLLIEQHLRHRLFGILADEDKAETRLKQIPIVHYHGQLGPVLEPLPATGTRLQIPTYAYEFLSDFQDDSAYQSSKTLRFFWETDSNSQTRGEALKVLGDSEQIAVLGVGRAMKPLFSLLEGLPSAWWQTNGFRMNTLGLSDGDRSRITAFTSARGFTSPLPQQKAADFITSLI